MIRPRLHDFNLVHYDGHRFYLDAVRFLIKYPHAAITFFGGDGQEHVITDEMSDTTIDEVLKSGKPPEDIH